MSVSCTLADSSVSVRVGESCNSQHGFGDGVPMLRAELQAVQFAEDLDPAHCPLNIRVVVDVAQRAKRQIRFRAGQIVELAARSLREHPDGIAAVKSEDLGAWISEPLGRDQTERGRLAGSGRPDNQRVAEVGDMQIEAEGSRPGGRGKQSGGLFFGISADGFSRRPAQTEVIGSMSARFSVCMRTRRTLE